MTFKIEGWFPPAIVTALDGIRYAVCGSNWIAISNEMTMEDVIKGWVCIAKDSPSRKPTSIFPKRRTKKEVMDSLNIH